MGERLAPAGHVMALPASGSDNRHPLLPQDAIGHLQVILSPHILAQITGVRESDGRIATPVGVNEVRGQGSRLLLRTQEGREVRGEGDM